jgi:hypothetical protein
MHCSSSDLPNRHAIKRNISQLVRRKLDMLGLLAHEAEEAPPHSPSSRTAASR